MKTYQDFSAIGTDERDRMQFCLTAVEEHKTDPVTKEAAIAQQYYEGLNVTITTVDKFITDAYGQKIPDIWSPNHKIKSHLYPYFINQEVLYLLGNGISFSNEDTLEKLGKKFEKTVMELAVDALNGGAAFGFWNFDHLEGFKLTEFVPLYDEDTGRLMAGIRYWQLDNNKPLRMTLFETDGYTEYIKRKSEDITVYSEKKAYVQVVSQSATGTEIAPGESYPGLPIIPLYNTNKKSAMYGNRETIDAYDLTVSKLVNNIDNGEFIYWIIKNAPYMADEPDELQAFIQKLRTSGVVALGDGQEVDQHKVDIPFQASDTTLSLLRGQLFTDFMAFDPLSIASGAETATRIMASYEPLNEKTDLFDYCVTDFIDGILEIAGIEDTPTYTRSMIVNKHEEAQLVIQAAQFMDSEYTTKKLLEILGDADKVQEVLDRRQQEEAERFALAAGMTDEG